MSKSVDVSKPLKKIVTKLIKNEKWFYSVEFLFVDGSYQRLGMENP